MCCVNAGLRAKSLGLPTKRPAVSPDLSCKIPWIRSFSKFLDHDAGSNLNVQESLVVPAGQTTSPTERASSVSDHGSSPQQKASALPQKAVPVAKGSTSPQKKAVPVAKGSTSPQEKAVPLAKGSTSPQEKALPVATSSRSAKQHSPAFPNAAVLKETPHKGIAFKLTPRAKARTAAAASLAPSAVKASPADVSSSNISVVTSLPGKVKPSGMPEAAAALEVPSVGPSRASSAQLAADASLLQSDPVITPQTDAAETAVGSEPYPAGPITACGRLPATFRYDLSTAAAHPLPDRTTVAAADSQVHSLQAGDEASLLASGATVDRPVDMQDALPPPPLPSSEPPPPSSPPLPPPSPPHEAHDLPPLPPASSAAAEQAAEPAVAQVAGQAAAPPPSLPAQQTAAAADDDVSFTLHVPPLPPIPAAEQAAVAAVAQSAAAHRPSLSTSAAAAEKTPTATSGEGQRARATALLSSPSRKRGREDCSDRVPGQSSATFPAPPLSPPVSPTSLQLPAGQLPSGANSGQWGARRSSSSRRAQWGSPGPFEADRVPTGALPSDIGTQLQPCFHSQSVPVGSQVTLGPAPVGSEGMPGPGPSETDKSAAFDSVAAWGMSRRGPSAPRGSPNLPWGNGTLPPPAPRSSPNQSPPLPWSNTGLASSASRGSPNLGPPPPWGSTGPALLAPKGSPNLGPHSSWGRAGPGPLTLRGSPDRGPPPPWGSAGPAQLHPISRGNSLSQSRGTLRSSHWNVTVQKTQNPVSPSLTSALTDSSGFSGSHTQQQHSSAAASAQSGGRHQQHAHSQEQQAAQEWWVPNPDVSNQCQTSRVTLHYTWGQPGIESAPVGDLDLTARVWSAQRMGLRTAASGDVMALGSFSDCS